MAYRGAGAGAGAGARSEVSKRGCPSRRRPWLTASLGLTHPLRDKLFRSPSPRSASPLTFATSDGRVGLVTGVFLVWWSLAGWCCHVKRVHRRTPVVTAMWNEFRSVEEARVFSLSRSVPRKGLMRTVINDLFPRTAQPPRGPGNPASEIPWRLDALPDQVRKGPLPGTPPQLVPPTGPVPALSQSHLLAPKVSRTPSRPWASKAHVLSSTLWRPDVRLGVPRLIWTQPRCRLSLLFLRSPFRVSARRRVFLSQKLGALSLLLSLCNVVCPGHGTGRLPVLSLPWEVSS